MHSSRSRDGLRRPENTWWRYTSLMPATVKTVEKGGYGPKKHKDTKCTLCLLLETL